jgi:rRNA maturation RNase YbeY
MKSSKVQCLVLSRKRIPKAHVVQLCEKLFKIFAKNSKIKKAKPEKRIKGSGALANDIPLLTVVFMDQAQAKKLNKKYRGKNYATDILSFAPEAKGQGLGELVLCESVLRRQAKEHKLSFNEEMDYLLIHGFLHLLGYDHEKSRKEEVKMMRLQDKLFEKLNRP